MKFNPNRLDKVHDNYFFYNLFGTYANFRHKNCRALLPCQNYILKHPSKNPNWRVQPLFMLMVFIFPLVWVLGVAFSIDEIIMRLKGHYAGKKKDDLQIKRWWITDICYFFRKKKDIKFLCAMILCQKYI